MSRARSPFAAALASLKTALAALRVDWYVFGAQAALLYGAARVTADIDVTIRLGKVTAARLATTLKQHGFSLRVDEPSFVRTTRVLPVVHVGSSVPADLVLAGPGLEDLFLEHAVMRDIGGVAVPVACAEDLIVMKVLAGRDKDLEDVRAILAAIRTDLDVMAVTKLLTMVEEALGQSDLVPSWERLRASVGPARHSKVETKIPSRKRSKAPVSRRTRGTKKSPSKKSAAKRAKR